jgi:hypothetical protein
VTARFVTAMLLLRAARLAARVGLALHRAPAPPPAPPSLPGAAARGGDPIPLVPIAQKFGLSDGFDHLTPAELPRSHRYPPAMALPKALLVAGLAVDLRDLPASAPDPARWLGTPASRRWGWDRPEAFAALRVQGPNAGWLRRDGDGYVVDLRILADLPRRPDRRVDGCLAAFDGDLRPRFVEVAGRRVSPDDPGWDLARRAFACADLHVHEAVSHFLWTHVVGEKLLLATLRQLHRDHPVRRLLEPHFAGTLQANENSGSRLLGEQGFFGRCFSAGWPGIAELLRRGAERWRWERLILPQDLRERGVTELPDYPYRDDGLLLWDAVERYVGAVVRAWYPSDDAVRADPEVAAWSAEIGGWLPSAPRVNGVAALTEVTAGALFAVVQHTLVNALQYDAFGDPASWPASLGPEGELPGGVEAVDAVRATFGFSIQYNALGDGLLAWHPPATRPAAERFLADLRAARVEIDAREARRPWPYRIARPDRVSNSINA